MHGYTLLTHNDALCLGVSDRRVKVKVSSGFKPFRDVFRHEKSISAKPEE
ncbi:hypothetical protein GCM10007876_24320 [Litoribrevibacter albus]|uniref:Uncharacterized protein n=1 Tax=Litoribrevibacter albus TaxID=1473156 RepID=A0AA37SCH9_9GAMM|nr:hypothetical protein GCM10007876_24320 [Litoribrevibacter albus]